MPFKKYSLIKYLLVPFIAYFFYWAVWFEMGMMQKTIQEAWSASYPNWILLFSLVDLEIFVLYREYKSKTKMLAKVEATKGDPWREPAKHKPKDPDSLKYFMRSTVEKWDSRFENAFDSIGGTTLHKRVFLKLKRISYMFLFLLYIALAFMSLNNPLYLILFVITAYAFLENLLWARHHKWVRRKQNERN